MLPAIKVTQNANQKVAYLFRFRKKVSKFVRNHCPSCSPGIFRAHATGAVNLAAIFWITAANRIHQGFLRNEQTFSGRAEKSLLTERQM